MTAAARARESARPDRLFEDPWAEVLAGSAGCAFLERQDEVLPPTPIFVVRHRFFDDFLLRSSDQEINQVVLIAAGLDTRAYRLKWPAGVRIYELDQPDVLAYKQAVLDQAGASPNCERRAVPTDLREDWATDLVAAGFERSKPTAWLAEGLLFYLPESAVGSLLSSTATLSAQGSVLGTDTMSATMLASEERRAWVRLYAESGAPFVFGTDHPADLLIAHGWQPKIHIAREIGEQLGRPWPIPPQPGQPPGAIITATRA